MAHLITLALFLFAGSCYATQRIVGGSEVAIALHPSIVQIEFQGVGSGVWSQNCAGTILNNIFVLSAASCFSGALYAPSLRRVRAGTSNRNSGGSIIGVRAAVNHPGFNVATSFDADITLVRLEGFLSFTSNIQAANIPSSESVIGDNQAVVKAGWGRTEENGAHSSTLLHAIVFTVNREICRQRYASLPIPAQITDNMLCAGFPVDGGRDSCQGDAGGPVYIANIVVGVISFGHGCGNADFPGVATDVISFSDWIIETANNNA